jgi:hypothetical protein
MAKTAGVILTMEPPRKPMGWQIEYEVCYDKKAEEHPAVEISVSMEDSIHWFCREKKFRVVSVDPDDASKAAGAPAQLFYRRFPEDNTQFAFHVNSGPARPGTEKSFTYKPVFEFDDNDGDPKKERTKLDPHIKTHL